MAPSKERVDAFFVEAKALHQEYHDEDDILDFDERLEELIPDLVAHLLMISDRHYGHVPLESILAQFFGIITIYAFDPDINETVKELLS